MEARLSVDDMRSLTRHPVSGHRQIPAIAARPPITRRVFTIIRRGQLTWYGAILSRVSVSHG
jgi:hypothetical protein